MNNPPNNLDFIDFDAPESTDAPDAPDAPGAQGRPAARIALVLLALMVPPILAVFAALSRLYAAQSGSGSQVLTVTVRVSGATHAYIAESAALSTASTGLRFAPVLVGCAAVAVLATLLAVLGKPKTRRFGLASLFTLFGLLSGLSIAMWLSTWSGELASFGAASSHLSIGPGAWLASGAALVQGAAAVTLARPSARRLE